MVGRLLQNELSKVARTKLPYFGLFAVGVICALTYAVGDQLSPSDAANAWGFVALAMQLAFTDVGPVFILVFAGLLMAEETESGTLQAVLTSPVARWEVYVAKALAGLVYMIVMSVACLALAAALGALRHDYGPVVDTLGEVYRVREVFANLLLACVASWVPLGALVMCGLLVSTLIRRPGAAVAVGLGMVYLIDFTKHLVGVDPYIFTRYISYPWQVLHHVAGGVDYQWTPELWRMIGLCGAYALGAGVTGLVVFRRQDLNA